MKRIENKYGVKVDLEIKRASDFSSVKEFNAYKKQLTHFTSRYSNKYDVVNDEGKKLPMKSIVQYAREVERVNKLKEIDFKKYADKPHKLRGKETGMTVAERQALESHTMKGKSMNKIHFDPHRFHSKEHLEKYVKNIKDTFDGDFIARKNKQYYENYLKSLDHAFLGDAQHIRELVEKMSVDEFIEYAKSEEFISVDYNYSKESRDAKIVEIENSFKWFWNSWE